VHGPHLIICDGPTAALDANRGHVVMELFEDVARSKELAALIVMHEIRIFHPASRIASMDDRRLIEGHHVGEWNSPP
jgi:putative ABC transport system ATP-binding protein